RKRNQNPHYLSSVKFSPKMIFPTHDLLEVVRQSQVLILAVPSAYAQDLISSIEAKEWKDKWIVSAIKGILPESNQFIHEYMQAHKDMDPQHYMVISGPCHAEEVAQERLSYLTFSGQDKAITQEISQYFENAYIRRMINHDVYGVQMASVLKNVYAIGAGIAHGLDYGDNFLSVYASNAYREMYGFLTHVFEQQDRKSTRLNSVT